MPSQRISNLSLNIVIYIIDDNEEYNFYLSKLLKNNNYIVKSFKNAKDFFYEIEQIIIKPDLVIIDLSMPDLNGLDIINSLRNKDNYKDLNKIIVSAKTEFKDRKEFKDIPFFSKPIDEVNFIKNIEKLVGAAQVIPNFNKNISRKCQIFCFLENFLFHAKIIITKIFPKEVEFISEVKFNFNSIIKFYSRSFADLLGVSCEFKLNIKDTKKLNNIFISRAELILDNKYDYAKIYKFIEGKLV